MTEEPKQDLKEISHNAKERLFNKGRFAKQKHLEEKVEPTTSEQPKEVTQNKKINEIRRDSQGTDYERSQYEVVESGFYFMYKGRLYFNSRNGEDGFTKVQVREIGSQIESALKKRLFIKGELGKYVMIESGMQSYFVKIDKYGEVYVPEMVGSGEKFIDKRYIRTNDSRQIRDLLKS